jgi:phosphoglycerate dehydrogenase-like enzyme
MDDAGVNRLLILTEDADKFVPLIEAAELPQLDIVSACEIEAAAELAVDCNIILGEPPLVSAVIARARELEWVQSSWAGIDRLCQPEMRRDYILTGVKEIFGALISEYVIAYLYGLERQVFEMRANQFKKHWQPKPYRLSKDINLGIVGLGSIGQHLARTAQQLGIHVTGFNRSGKDDGIVEKVYTSDSLAEFLTDLDYVVLTLPDTPGTRNFINADALRMMKSSAVLINVGRGGIVNEEDLIMALQQGEIGAAVLDVFATEPLPAESLLWSLPNAYVTPHFAAASFPQDVVKIFVENYHRFIRKDPLLYRIDFELGY